MMKLADQIEAMRRSMVEENDFTKNQLEHLEKRMLAGDAEIIARIHGIIDKQSQNAATILDGLLTIASRIGHLPSPARPVESAKPAAASNVPPPLPPGGARAPSYIPPMPAHLAHATMNEILEAAGNEARH